MEPLSTGRALMVAHCVCLFWSVFVVTQNVGLTNDPYLEMKRTFGGPWKYLTFLNQSLQIVLFVICVIHDVIYICNPTRRKGLPVHIVNVRDWMFSVLVFPIGTFVVFTFWIFYAFDRKFIFNRELDGTSPSWINHFIHTTILPLLVIELIICPHKYPSRKKGVLGLSIFASIYIIWILWINYTSGIWAYPLLENLNKSGLVVFFTSSYFGIVGFYFLGAWLTKLIWDSENQNKTTERSRKVEEYKKLKCNYECVVLID
ncbi:androgen-induced gene 1 protein-like [Sarcophilus harrisii]|uniref:Androgen dependent TFPI regulating protein n=1 Tax=Sarcophilus harrisii TaxID=9305 RepID=A0A7N4PER7_SARHA|nr:androgen-induced gene 1 protein-like [Sarcophilus harrisii]